jgi:hypothetical protein
MRRLALLFLLSAAACARTDVGAPCHLIDPQGGELSQLPGREYIFLGSSECQSFSCLATPGTAGGYCSQSCAGPSASCPAGLSCAALSIDDGYLATLKARLPPAQFDALFSQLGGTFYCQRPR